MQLPHRVETYFVASWTDFTKLVQDTYHRPIYFDFVEENWGRGPMVYHARSALLQDMDTEDLALLIDKGSSKIAEVDDALDLVLTDLCNRQVILPGRYMFYR